MDTFSTLQNRAEAQRCLTLSRREACALYASVIGYDPHEDDPSISTGLILATLHQREQEARP